MVLVALGSFCYKWWRCCRQKSNTQLKPNSTQLIATNHRLIVAYNKHFLSYFRGLLVMNNGAWRFGFWCRTGRNDYGTNFQTPTDDTFRCSYSVECNVLPHILVSVFSETILTVNCSSCTKIHCNNGELTRKQTKYIAILKFIRLISADVLEPLLIRKMLS